RSTDSPAHLYDGGALLTFGEHKTYALSLLVEIMGGILSGGGTPVSPECKQLSNGVFALVIDPGFFRPQAEYGAAVDYLFGIVKQALPAHGKNGALIPGEPEVACMAMRETAG